MKGEVKKKREESKRGKGKTKENKKKLLMSKNITCNHSHDQKPYPILDAIEVGFPFSLSLFFFSLPWLVTRHGTRCFAGGFGEGRRRRRRKGG